MCGKKTKQIHFKNIYSGVKVLVKELFFSCISHNYYRVRGNYLNIKIIK